MNALDWLNRAVTGVLKALVVASLAAMSVLTVIDAGGRYLLNRPVAGSVELTELLMVALIFASIPLVTAARGHVVVDSFSGLVPSHFRRAQQTLAHLLACGISVLLAAVALKKAASVADYGDMTPMIGIPLAPFVYLMGTLLALNALLHAAHGIGVILPSRGPHD